MFVVLQHGVLSTGGTSTTVDVVGIILVGPQSLVWRAYSYGSQRKQRNHE